MHRRRRSATAALVGLLWLGACNGPAPEPDGGETTTTIETTSTTAGTTTTEDGALPGEPTSTTAPSPPFAGTTTPTSAPPPPGSTEVALLADVQVGGGAGVDRVVFRFADAHLPGYEVAYADGPVHQDGSGEVVPVEGRARLRVRFEPASGVDLRSGSFEETYRGPDRVRGETSRITEVVSTGDFEGNLTWVVGIDATAPYRVEVVRGDSTIVVEVGR